MSARLGPEWRALVERLRDVAGCLHDHACGLEPAEQRWQEATEGLHDIAAALLAADRAGEAGSVTCLGCEAELPQRDGMHIGAGGRPAFACAASPAPAAEDELELSALVSHLCAATTKAQQDEAVQALREYVQRREAAARGTVGKVKREGPWRGAWNGWIAPFHVCPWCGESLDWRQGEDALERPLIHANCCGIEHIASMTWRSQPHDD